MSKLPLQPIYTDEDGRNRFRQNKVVRYLLDNGGLDLNDLAKAINDEDAKEDWEQFAQLIGYSLSGFSELIRFTFNCYAIDRISSLRLEC